MKNDRKIRLLVADDHPVVREGLRSLVNQQDDMKVVAEAATGREAIEQFLQYKPDIALIDLRMAEMSGIEAIVAIREQTPSAQTILISTYSGDEDVYQSLRASAKAYLLKDAPREELLGCIRAVHKGQT
jgi:DNA-binding NarL/FixJ family response regulator